LLLNKIENKKKVIQNKIIQFYFVGDFDLAPFASLPLSVLARVMSLGERVEFDLVSCANMSRAFLDKYQRIHLEGIPNKQTAIFELLRGIPELCNVSARRKRTITIQLSFWVPSVKRFTSRCANKYCCLFYVNG
jgi:hypothetical protein